MGSPTRQDEERVLVIAPTARDARLSQALFEQAGLNCAICQDLATFAAEIDRGVGVVVLTEEALLPGRQPLLAAALAAQPPWSSLPVILLAGARHQQLRRAALVQQLGNVLILERPISSQTLLSVVEMALRTRRRQYQARLMVEVGRLLTAWLSDEGTLAAVAALLAPYLADCCLIHTFDGTRWRLAALHVAPEAAQAEARLMEFLVAAAPEGEPPSADALDLTRRQLQIAGATDCMVVPLEVQGQVLGRLSLGMLTADRAFHATDRQVVDEVAAHLSLALNQGRLYRAEQSARAEAEAAVQARDALIALISHDLKNPLSAVLGQSQLLRRQLGSGDPDTERMLRAVVAVERAAGKMHTQIAELLDVARVRAGQPLDLQRKPTDLVALAQTVAAATQLAAERHQINVTSPLPELVALVDPLRIERVLDNLLSNAVKYSPGGGVISMAVNREDAGGAGWALLEVRDAGIGIPAGDLPHIFERFRRGSNVTPTVRGTGLGLASVRQIVEQHGGQVSIVSPAEGGTLVTIRLPLHDESA